MYIKFSFCLFRTNRFALTAACQFDANEIERIDADFSALERLEELRFDCNRLTSLPPDVARLTSLRYIYVNDNAALTSMCDLRLLTSVIDLRCHDCRLSSIDGLECLSQLDTLFVSSKVDERLRKLFDYLNHCIRR